MGGGQSRCVGSKEPPSTSMAARDIPSAMVEQAPYRPKKEGVLCPEGSRRWQCTDSAGLRQRHSPIDRMKSPLCPGHRKGPASALPSLLSPSFFQRSCHPGWRSQSSGPGDLVPLSSLRHCQSRQWREGKEADGLPPKFFRVQSILSLDLDCAFIVCFPGRIIQERQKRCLASTTARRQKRKAWTFRPLLYYNKAITD